MNKIEQKKLAIERARLFFGCYRRGDANDPEVYVRAVGAVLEAFDPDIIREVTDPRTGMCRSEKFSAFLPNAGEVARYCEEVASRRARMRQYAEQPRPDLSRPRLPAPVQYAPGRRANLLVKPGRPRYEEMCERARQTDADPAEFEWMPDGAIKVSLLWRTGEPGVQIRLPEMHARSNR